MYDTSNHTQKTGQVNIHGLPVPELHRQWTLRKPTRSWTSRKDVNFLTQRQPLGLVEKDIFEDLGV